MFIKRIHLLKLFTCEYKRIKIFTLHLCDVSISVVAAEIFESLDFTHEYKVALFLRQDAICK
jgi:hypothetical protein